MPHTGLAGTLKIDLTTLCECGRSKQNPEQGKQFSHNFHESIAEQNYHKINKYCHI